MAKRHLQYLLPLILAFVFLFACASRQSTTSTASTKNHAAFKSFKDYPDHAFNVKDYIKAMEKGGHNLLLWQDPSVNLKQYHSVNISRFGERLLPEQNRFSYSPFTMNFNRTFESSMTIKRSSSNNALQIRGELVECNPGNRAARYLRGFGAGKVACAVVCEVYEPNKTKPCLSIYARDTSSYGAFGGDSVAAINYIFDQLAFRVSSVLKARIGR